LSRAFSDIIRGLLLAGWQVERDAYVFLSKLPALPSGDSDAVVTSLVAIAEKRKPLQRAISCSMVQEYVAAPVPEENTRLVIGVRLKEPVKPGTGSTVQSQEKSCPHDEQPPAAKVTANEMETAEITSAAMYDQDADLREGWKRHLAALEEYKLSAVQLKDLFVKMHVGWKKGTLSNEYKHFFEMQETRGMDRQTHPPLPAVTTERSQPPALSSPSEKKDAPACTAVVNVAESVRASRPFAAEVEGRVEVIRDPTSALRSGRSGTVEEFTELFRYRFKRFVEIFHDRMDARNGVPLSDATSARAGEHVKFIAMVMEKREKGGRIFFRVDDMTADATLLVDGSRDRQLYEVAQLVPLDQVICVEAVRGSGALLVAEKILLPDIPDKPIKGASRDEIYAILLSDAHIGSKLFLEDTFEHVIQWLNGKIGTANQRWVAERTKYLVFAGDLVDGVGRYPRQESELKITSIYEQYKYAASFIERIPEHVEIILIPGNHDGVRQALPQPAIPANFAEPVYEAHKITTLGNPAYVMLHGVKFLLHHGRSLEDVITGAPTLSFQAPEKAMRLQLRCRHIAPTYGNRTAIAALPVDLLMIDEVPDVFQSGHLHVIGQEHYRGTLVVNSGAWQAQTSYQVQMGLKPTPGILPIVNLQTLKLSLSNFNPTSEAAAS
jgi:DNA polymerase II small subunit